MNVPGLFFPPNGIPEFIPVEAARPVGPPVPLPREYARPDGDQFARVPFDIPKRLVTAFFKLVKLIRILPCIQRPNKRLARLCGVSVSTIKRWLVKLAEEGLIFILNPKSKDRTIWVLRGVKKRKHNPNSAKGSGQKNLGAVRLTCEPVTGSLVVPIPSLEGTRCKDQQAPGGGESDGTDPPPGLGEEAPSAEAPLTEAQIDAFRAETARIAAQAEATRPASEPATRPTSSPEPSRPIKPTAEALERAEARKAELAAQIAAIAERDKPAAKRAEPHDPAPPSTPPPARVEPPRSDPPRASPVVFGRSLIAWLRKQLE